jgi:adenylylsulfate kinase
MTGERGFVLWFTGLPRAGKTTLARAVGGELERRGEPVEVLDGDEIRATLCQGLGFSREDRDANVERAGYVAGKLAKHGIAALVAIVAPYREARQRVRASVPRFFEVYVKAPVEVCASRDHTGMYQKAQAGEIDHFTGVSDPYEEPEAPDLVVETDREPTGRSAERVLELLEAHGMLGQARPATAGDQDDVYSDEEEEAVEERLTALGYLG